MFTAPTTDATGESPAIEKRLKQLHALVIRKTNHGPIIEEYRNGKLLNGNELDVPLPTPIRHRDGYQVGSVMMLQRFNFRTYSRFFPQDTLTDTVPWALLALKYVMNEKGDPSIYGIPFGWRVENIVYDGNGNGNVIVKAVRFEKDNVIEIKGAGSSRSISEQELNNMFYGHKLSGGSGLVFGTGLSIQHGILEAMFFFTGVGVEKIGVKFIVEEWAKKITKHFLVKWSTKIGFSLIKELTKELLKDKDNFDRHRKNKTLNSYLPPILSKAFANVIESEIIGSIANVMDFDPQIREGMKKYIIAASMKLFGEKLINFLIKEMASLSSQLDFEFRQLILKEKSGGKPAHNINNEVELVSKMYDYRGDYIAEFTKRLLKDFARTIVNMN